MYLENYLKNVWKLKRRERERERNTRTSISVCHRRDCRGGNARQHRVGRRIHIVLVALEARCVQCGQYGAFHSELERRICCLHAIYSHCYRKPCATERRADGEASARRVLVLVVGPNEVVVGDGG